MRLPIQTVNTDFVACFFVLSRVFTHMKHVLLSPSFQHIQPNLYYSFSMAARFAYSQGGVFSRPVKLATRCDVRSSWCYVSSSGLEVEWVVCFSVLF